MIDKVLQRGGIHTRYAAYPSNEANRKQELDDTAQLRAQHRSEISSVALDDTVRESSTS
jgi:hypothetical protein